ncbi:GntR family transcriptional regulator [Rubrivivax sp. A210]|uniref:GntR family transcriptional regulator n=1 Tax=Rubrivivax sp. A210 TaxID=2772301 RepID=UPI0019195410|nr:GntR family transcriptional regulator [Rubrivivax sp. A210]CAD5372426.1 GntR family transcriptional regulator [Rubrivivax sp. A210]
MSASATLSDLPATEAGAGTAVEATPSFSPLYRQIKALLVRGLQEGEWLPGQAIPSELVLAARFRVSQGTVRKAIDEMATDNLLVRRQGKGTFVASHAEQATQYRFLRLQPDDGSATPLQRRLLDCRRMRAPAEVARLLDLKAGEPAVQVRRLLLAPAEAAAAPRPVVLDDLWLPGTLFKGLTAERLAAWRGPLYRLFEAEFAVQTIGAEEKIRAVAASAEEAALLEVAPGAPLLSVERLTHTYGERPVELRRGLYHTAAHHYRNVLS